MTGRLIVSLFPPEYRQMCFGEALIKKNRFSSLEDLTLKVQDVKIPPAGANRSCAQTLNASLMLIGASGNLCQLVPAGIWRLI